MNITRLSANNQAVKSQRMYFIFVCLFNRDIYQNFYIIIKFGEIDVFNAFLISVTFFVPSVSDLNLCFRPLGCEI